MGTLNHPLLVSVVMPIVESEAKITLRVHPRAAKNEVVGFADGIWQVRVAAPPIKGKANRELITFLKQCLGVSTLAIIRGHNSRNKVIAIYGLSQDEIRKRLSPKPFSSSGNASR